MGCRGAVQAWLAFTIFLMLVGCGPSLETRLLRPGSTNLEKTWMVGVARSVSVGETMTSSSPFVIYPALKLNKGIIAHTSHRGKPFTATLFAGDYEFDGTDEQGSFFVSPKPIRILVREKNKDSRYGGIYLPNNESFPPAIYWRWAGKSDGRVSVFVANSTENPSINITNDIFLPNDMVGFVTTLTYGGVANGQIKFIYREYTNGLARVAFTQEVTLDYEPNKLYAYKNSRFIVHNADSIKIEYTLVKPLIFNNIEDWTDELLNNNSKEPSRPFSAPSIRSL